MRIRSFASVMVAVLVTSAPVVHAEEFSLRNAAMNVRPEPVTSLEMPFGAAGNTNGGTTARKSTAKAMLYSLLLPGLGHQYLGNVGMARAFYVAEGGIWASFVALRVQGHLRQDGYEEFAQTFGAVGSSDHSDDYWRILTEFDSFQEYEDEIKTDARAELYPDPQTFVDPDVQTAQLEAYFVAHRVSDYEPWVWDSASRRRTYQGRRASSRRAFRRAIYAASASLANRAVSMFFAVRSARSYNKRLNEQARNYHLEFGPPRYTPGDTFQTGVSIVRKF